MIARKSDKRLQNVRFNCVNAKQNTYAIADKKNFLLYYFYSNFEKKFSIIVIEKFNIFSRSNNRYV